MSHKEHDTSTDSAGSSALTSNEQDSEQVVDVEAPLLSTIAARQALTQRTDDLLGIYAPLNKKPDLDKNLPGWTARMSAAFNAINDDFIRGAWSPVVFALMAKYDPTGWLQFLSSVSNMLVYTGVGMGVANAMLGQLKDHYSPEGKTPAFIAQLRELNDRVLADGLALNRLLSEEWGSLLTTETTMLTSHLVDIEARLQIHSEEAYLRDSNPASTTKTIYDCTQTILSAMNYAASGALIAKVTQDFFDQSIDPINGATWVKGVALGYEAGLAVTGAALSAFRAQAAQRRLISTNEQVRDLISNTDRLAEMNRGLYDQLREKFGLPAIASVRSGNLHYGAVANKPKFEELVTEMSTRAHAITGHASHHHSGLFAVNQGAGVGAPGRSLA